MPAIPNLARQHERQLWVEDRGRYRVPCPALKASVDLAEHAGVLTTVKDKARYCARACALLDLRCARRPTRRQIGTAE